jgi:hypothetical protein
MSVPGYAASGDNYAPRLFAALFPDKVYELLVSQIGDLPGISANERADRVRELEVRIMLLEHQEESLVAQALAQGLAGVFRRSDASPYALLSCSPGALAAKKEEPAMEMA